MAGEAIGAVTRGVHTLVTEMRSNPLALETVYLSLITFSREARQVLPLTELYHLQPPKLSVRPGTAMGAALRLLMNCLKRDVVRTTETTKGDYKPFIFILTDGQPTDDWQSAADRIKQKKVNIIACAAGSGADGPLLKRVTEIVVELDTLSPDALKAFFKWVSSSIKTTPQSVAQVAADAPVNLPPPPQIQIVP
jgi:uncharacterized protein YegL